MLTLHTVYMLFHASIWRAGWCFGTLSIVSVSIFIASYCFSLEFHVWCQLARADITHEISEHSLRKDLGKALIGQLLLQPPHVCDHIITDSDVWDQISTSHPAWLKLSVPHRNKTWLVQMMMMVSVIGRSVQAAPTLQMHESGALSKGLSHVCLFKIVVQL